MGKRSDFKRHKGDFYVTPYEAVVPLIQHLPFAGKRLQFWEPCAGDGTLIGHLCSFGLELFRGTDTEPKADGVEVQDALEIRKSFDGCDAFITNPPWSRNILHPIIDNLRRLHPTYLLFDADWMHTKQAAPYLKYCTLIVSVGRVKWIADSKHTGKDNACWYLFESAPQETKFIGR